MADITTTLSNFIRDMAGFSPRETVKAVEDLRDKVDVASQRSGDLFNDSSTATTALFARMGLGPVVHASGQGASHMVGQYSTATTPGDQLTLLATALGRMLDQIETLSKGQSAMAGVIAQWFKAERFPVAQDATKTGSGTKDEEDEKEEEAKKTAKAAIDALASKAAGGIDIAITDVAGFMNSIKGALATDGASKAAALAEAAKNNGSLSSPPSFVMKAANEPTLEDLLDMAGDGAPPQTLNAIQTLWHRREMVRAGKLDHARMVCSREEEMGIRSVVPDSILQEMRVLQAVH